MAMLVLAGAGVVVFGVLAPPERCPTVSEDDLERSATAAVGWFVRNQDDDGRWLYLYDAQTNETISEYNVVRHMGVQMSLYQAASAGVAGAAESADLGLAWSLDQVVDVGDGSAVEHRGRIAVGASALLVTGLAERRLATGDHQYDDLMNRLGSFLAAQTEASGAVLAYFDRSAGTPVAGEYSKYYTGEAYWALTRLHVAFPDGGWDDVADRVGGYLAVQRDDNEGYRLPLPDHWAAYGLSETAGFGDRSAFAPLTDEERAYARRQAGLFSAQVRWLSQQAGPWGEAVRGTRELRGGGYGVIGEALTGLWIAAGEDPRLTDLREPLASRATCIAGLAVAKQVDSAEAAQFADAQKAVGAWFANGQTRMDDQQHALSAILRTIPIVASTTGDDSDGPAPAVGLWVVAIVAAVNPLRLVLAVRDGVQPAGDVTRLAVLGGVAGMVLTIGVAAASVPLLDVTSVTDSAMRVAAGIVAGVAAIVTLVRKPPPFQPALPGLRAALVPVAVPFVANAAAVTLGIGAFADHGVSTVVIGAAAVVGVLALVALGGRRSGMLSDRVLSWGARLVSALMVVVAVQLVIDGVLGV